MTPPFVLNPDGSLTITLPIQLTSKLPNGTFAQIPASPTPGDSYLALDQPKGQQLYLCSAVGVWTQQLNLGGSGALQLDGGSLDINLATMPMLQRENTWTGLNHFKGEVDFINTAAGIWVSASSAVAQPVPARVVTPLTFEINLPGSTPGIHTAPGQFTIPRDGLYRGFAQLRSLNSTGAVYLDVLRNAAEIAENGWPGGPFGGPSIQTAFSLPLLKGDVLTVTASTWSDNYTVDSAMFVLEG